MFRQDCQVPYIPFIIVALTDIQNIENQYHTCVLSQNAKGQAQRFTRAIRVSFAGLEAQMFSGQYGDKLTNVHVQNF